MHSLTLPLTSFSLRRFLSLPHVNPLFSHVIIFIQRLSNPFLPTPLHLNHSLSNSSAHESPSRAFFLVKYRSDEINSWLINFFQDKDSDSDSGEDPEKKKVWSIFNPFWMARNLSYRTKRKKKNKHFGFHVTLARSWSILEPLRDGHLLIASKFPSCRSYWGRGLS